MDVRSIIMGVVVAVSIGYILVWMMIPTKVYRETWLPKIQTFTNSTYFDSKGSTRLLMFTFPVLFVAILGCVYLHLRKNSSHTNFKEVKSKHDKLGIWRRRPLIIKWLGIVSRIELVFLLMFIALLVWSFSNDLYIHFADITPHSAAKFGKKVWEAKLEAVAVRLGIAGNTCLCFLFFPVTRGSSVLQLFELTSEASIKYHIWLGHMALTLFSAHGICYITFWTTTHQFSQMVKWAKTGISNMAGEFALLCGLVIWATTLPRIRRNMFELFFYTHHLYILFIIFFFFHVGLYYSLIMLPGLYLFMIDRFLRFLQSTQNVRLVSARILPCETIELNFSKSKSLDYTACSIVFLNVPSISRLQWHPFTVTSNSNMETENLSVVIKGEGSWSKKLYQLLSSPDPVDRLHVSVEGPYGPPSTHFLRHDLLVMISGGSGITPFISIIRELIHLKCNTPEILLVTVFKNSSQLTMLQLLLPISGATSQFSKLCLQIEGYVTREKQFMENKNKNLRTIWFKPDPHDVPITPILGKNSWLWLGAIISSSFIIFLLISGILTRYYIYPIDKNTNKIYPYPKKCVLYMLFMSISIAITATAAFVWNKRHIAMEAKQIEKMEDGEIESMQQQSLVQSTNLHFGGRPDLKRILLERKEESVGVLVCGPKKMRHEVADICSSDLADNLHFESISFSW